MMEQTDTGVGQKCRICGKIIIQDEEWDWTEHNFTKPKHLTCDQEIFNKILEHFSAKYIDIPNEHLIDWLTEHLVNERFEDFVLLSEGIGIETVQQEFEDKKEDYYPNLYGI